MQNSQDDEPLLNRAGRPATNHNTYELRDKFKNAYSFLKRLLWCKKTKNKVTVGEGKTNTETSFETPYQYNSTNIIKTISPNNKETLFQRFQE